MVLINLVITMMYSNSSTMLSSILSMYPSNKFTYSIVLRATFIKEKNILPNQYESLLCKKSLKCATYLSNIFSIFIYP